MDQLSVDTVAQLIDNKSATIIDVRNENEFKDGHLPGAVNVPSNLFDDETFVDSLVAKYKDENQLVFHCMHSQKRGPTCAKQFASRAGNDSKPKM